MCDYSLMGVPNRLAKEGEDLILHQFPTGTRGFTPCAPGAEASSNWRNTARVFLKALLGVPEARKVAVCIPPGARMLLLDVPLDLRAAENVPRDAEVTFTQLSAQAYAHRDAIRFENGHELLLQFLDEGQRIRILEMDPTGEAEALPERVEAFGIATRRVDFIASRLVG
jgi:hypothetical protein